MKLVPLFTLLSEGHSLKILWYLWKEKDFAELRDRPGYSVMLWIGRISIFYNLHKGVASDIRKLHSNRVRCEKILHLSTPTECFI